MHLLFYFFIWASRRVAIGYRHATANEVGARTATLLTHDNYNHGKKKTTNF